jgi:hypothetical protein
MEEAPQRPRPVTDVSAADWVVEGVGEFASDIKGLLPVRFESYARILHPAWPSAGDRRSVRDAVPWRAVAAESGAVMHPQAQFDALIGAARGEARSYEPDVGELPRDLLSALCEVLEEHTATPQRCWYCIWDGWGWIEGSPAAGIAVLSDEVEGPIEMPPAFPPEIMDGPRVSLPHRDYILFEGTLRSATELGWRFGELLSAAHPELGFGAGDFDPQSPNLFWPHDHAWCVATEIDLDSTYVGGSRALVEALQKDPRFEALPARPDDRVDAASDRVNR